jgi:hypothetical protein
MHHAFLRPRNNTIDATSLVNDNNIYAAVATASILSIAKQPLVVLMTAS